MAFRPASPPRTGKATIEGVSEPESVVVVGDVAYTLSRDSLSMMPRDGGATVRLVGHRLTVYRRGSDGRWLLARDAHTLALVAVSGRSPRDT